MTDYLNTFIVKKLTTMAFDINLYRKSSAYKYANIRDLVLVLNQSKDLDKATEVLRKLVFEVDNFKEQQYLKLFLDKVYVNICCDNLNYDILGGNNLLDILKKIRNERSTVK